MLEYYKGKCRGSWGKKPVLVINLFFIVTLLKWSLKKPFGDSIVSAVGCMLTYLIFLYDYRFEMSEDNSK